MFWVVTVVFGDLATATWPAFGSACCARWARQRYQANMVSGSSCHASMDAMSCGSTFSHRPVWASR